MKIKKIIKRKLQNAKKTKNNNINIKNQRKESCSFSNFSKLRKDIAITSNINERILKGYKNPSIP